MEIEIEIEIDTYIDIDLIYYLDIEIYTCTQSSAAACLDIDFNGPRRVLFVDGVTIPTEGFSLSFQIYHSTTI